MRYRLMFVMVAILLSPALLLCQQPKTESVTAEHPAHQELRALRDDLLDAFNKQDLDRLLQYVTADVVATWQNAEVSRGHQGIRDYHNRMMVGANRIVESVTATAEVDELTRLYGPDKDSGIAFGRLDEDFRLTNGMNFHLVNRWTAHVLKEGGKWKVSAFHVSANLFDNPVLDVVVRRTALWTGGGALVVGLVVGLALARVFFPRARVQP